VVRQTFQLARCGYTLRVTSQTWTILSIRHFRRNFRSRFLHAPR
jgi:hypothetical protein